jgi:hypothetical protein
MGEGRFLFTEAKAISTNGSKGHSQGECLPERAQRHKPTGRARAGGGIIEEIRKDEL